MKTFIDTAPFIYIIENNPQFSKIVKSYLLEGFVDQSQFVTSVITIMEFGVNPIKKNRHELLNKFENFLHELKIEVVETNRSIAKKGATLRAKYDFLKGMDALQIATALETGCQQFYTNDKKLKNITEIKVIILSDFK